ncbi:hypothetical protein BJ980_002484 [Nocardioides daedukensis]|uniref:ChsH2 C-terminal OB-fold domain-containing protein n=1 Tax=Nocardioides daedukensis TaxID=634462 RepID=A0A7Y9URD1_9ACTN|nr:OB-fold domain-containing protein [Nocardioides daedukensis]NYG59561.1 hypothetical protein [Nocardioides daedukensis]
MTDPTAPLLPVTDDVDTGGFFLAAARGELAIRICSECRADLHLPRECCPHCGAFSREWRPVSGTGTLYSWTVVHHQVHPAFPVPYTVVLVEVDDTDGVRLVSRIAGCPDLEVGQPMEVWFEQVGDVTLPQWRPTATQEESA